MEGLNLESSYTAFLHGISSRTSLTPALETALRGRKLSKTGLPPVFQDTLDITKFALNQFKARAVRDGVTLILLMNDLLERQGVTRKAVGLMDRMQFLAEEQGIPVISLYDYVLRQNIRMKDISWRWAHDHHWTPTGHVWAGEALLEYLMQHPEVCEEQARLNEDPSASQGAILEDAFGGGR